MCGRYSVLTEDEIIEIRGILKTLSMALVKDEFEQYGEDSGEPSPSDEVRPTDSAPVITSQREGISFESAKWGFKKWDGSGVIINARSETMKLKSTFSKLVEAGRCVVPAGEFFEWEKVGDKKKRHYAKDRDGNLLFMAGLYREGKEGREFVIITKEATGEMQKIHDRIPVILRANQLEAWLNGTLTPEDIEKLEYDVSVVPCGADSDGDNEQLSMFFD
jgi:putative SOS response-associated peptidase YedK